MPGLQEGNVSEFGLRRGSAFGQLGEILSGSGRLEAQRSLWTSLRSKKLTFEKYNQNYQCRTEKSDI